VTDHNPSLAAHSLSNQAADEDNAKKVAKKQRKCHAP
jgi:hypothetical protein